MVRVVVFNDCDTLNVTRITLYPSPIKCSIMYHLVSFCPSIDDRYSWSLSVSESSSSLSSVVASLISVVTSLLHDLLLT